VRAGRDDVSVRAGVLGVETGIRGRWVVDEDMARKLRRVVGSFVLKFVQLASSEGRGTRSLSRSMYERDEEVAEKAEDAEAGRSPST
jgi:hypothetical protein